MYLPIENIQKERNRIEEEINEIDKQLNKNCTLKEQMRLVESKIRQLEFIKDTDNKLEYMNKGYEEAKTRAEKNYKLMAKTIRKLENPKELKLKNKPINASYQKFEEFYA